MKAITVPASYRGGAPPAPELLRTIPRRPQFVRHILQALAELGGSAPGAKGKPKAPRVRLGT